MPHPQSTAGGKRDLPPGREALKLLPRERLRQRDSTFPSTVCGSVVPKSIPAPPCPPARGGNGPHPGRTEGSVPPGAVRGRGGWGGELTGPRARRHSESARARAARACAAPTPTHTPRAPPPSRARRPLCLRAAATPPQRSPTNESPAWGGRGARPPRGCARGASPACVCARSAVRLRMARPAAQRARGGGLSAHARCGRRGPAGEGGPRMRAACPPLASSRGGGGGGGSWRGSARGVRGAAAAPVSGRTARRRRERPGGGGT